MTIEKLVEGGEGLGRFEQIAVLVADVAPGDRVKVDLTERHPGWARGNVIELLDEGPDRREPPCPHYSRCGGCNLQHLEDDAQRSAKVSAACETLRRLGGVIVKDPEVVFGSAWGYRQRAQFQVDSRAAGRARVGYHARKSHDVVAVDSCPILAPALEAVLRELPDLLPEQPPRRIDVAVGSEGEYGVAPLVEGLPHGELELVVGDDRLSFDARCFVQGHRELLEQLVQVVVGEHSDPEGVAWDLYSGVGLFTVPLAARYARVVAVESDGAAVHWARRNLKRAGRAATTEIRRLRVEMIQDHLKPGVSRVVADPPRTGLPLGARHALLRSRPNRLTYVSCQPATLARDLKDLLRGFRIDSTTFVDLFPQTSHIETVVQLIAEDK